MCECAIIQENVNFVLTEQLGDADLHTSVRCRQCQTATNTTTFGCLKKHWLQLETVPCSSGLNYSRPGVSVVNASYYNFLV